MLSDVVSDGTPALSARRRRSALARGSHRRRTRCLLEEAMPVLSTAQLIGWSCPVNLGASPPQPDADGSRPLLHVQDNAGNNFEVRCVKGGLGFHYEYSISLPDGTVKEFTRCIYDLGLNNAELVYTGAMSRVTSPTGTPVINVGALLVVEHSNQEGTGSAATGITPKAGGADFHMVYDYRQKLRYRLNTIIGKAITGTDYLASRALSPPHAILRADVTAIASPDDFARAIEGDTKFRRLDFPRAEPPCETCELQDEHTDASGIAYAYLKDDDGREG